MEILRRAPNDDSLTTTVAARHMALLHIDHADERMEICRHWVEIAERRSHQSIGFALHWLLYDLLERGDIANVEAVRGARARLRQIAETLKQPLVRRFVALLRREVGADARRRCRRRGESQGGLRIRRSCSGHPRGLLHAAQLFVLRQDPGRIGDFLDEVSGFLEPQHQTLPAAQAVLMVARCESGDRERAAADLTELARDGFATIPRDMFWLAALCLSAAAAAELNDRAVARELRSQLEPYERYNAQIGLAGVYQPVHGILGQLATLEGDRQAAAQRASSPYSGAPPSAPYRHRPRLRSEYAELLLSAPRPGADPRQLLEDSRTTALELGVVEVAKRAGQALRRIVPEVRARESVAET